MANQFLKLRRSAVPGRIPSTSSLDFGEIALNTYDGLAFLKKSGSNGEEIVTIGANNTIVTGSDSYLSIFSGSNAVVASSIYQRDGFTSIRNSTGPLDPSNPDILYVDGTDLNTYNLISAHNTLDNYTQINIQNFSAGSNASSDIVATNDIGTESENYINMGINSSGYQPSSLVGLANDAYVYSTANDLYIGNASAGHEVIIFNGGTDAGGNARVWIHDQGTIGINTGLYDPLNPPSLQIQAPNNTTINLITAKADIDHYSQFNLTNANAGISASSDIVVTNDIGDEESYYIDMGINSSGYILSGSVGNANDAYIYSTGNHLHIGNASDQPIMFFAGGFDADINQKLILYPNNQHEMTGSLNMSGSLTVGGTITAQTLIVQTITSSIDYVTGSTIFGSQLSNTHQFTGSVSITGSLNASIITGSLFGTASWSQNAVTASYVAAANVAGLSLFQIATGSITASVGLENDLFLIRSGSKTYFNISSSGDTTLYSSNFMVRDFTTNEIVFQLSGSKAYFDFDGLTIATQSVAPTGSADIGGILFTSGAMYIGLE